jgi:putative heme-binding domain-containing protein
MFVGAVSAAPAADPFEDVIRKTEPLEPVKERLAFHLPPGFQIELVACEPQIGKPINMAFDTRGRLWLTESREYPFAAPPDRRARDKIKVLSNFDAQGRALKVETFAEGLNIPVGLYPYKSGVIAFSIPNIYYFEHAAATDQAASGTKILGNFGYDKDVHGLTGSFRRGYDGWIYADHGFNNTSTLMARDGSTLKINSGNCYRFRLDGERVEPYSWGQVNPFGLMFDPLGDLWSADCHSSPVYQLLRGAYYPSFGKPNDGLGFAPGICDHQHGSTAIAGMVYYAAEQFPPEFRGNTFIGNVMTCRINRDSLIEHGSTRLAKEAPDFLSSTDPWFRPVDLQLGPDGAIYVADFYNRIIGHYEVPLTHPGRDRERGRIWRISYRGQDAHPKKIEASFDLSKSSARGLSRELAGPNITRRMLAMNELTDRLGNRAFNPMRRLLMDKKSNSFQRIHALWVLQRLNALDLPLLRRAAEDADFRVRAHAMKAVGETREFNPALGLILTAGTADKNPYVRRDAAEAMSRHPSVDNVLALLELRRAVSEDDPQLLHTVRMSLRDQLIPEETFVAIAPRLSRSEDRLAILDVTTGIKTSAAAEFILDNLQLITNRNDLLQASLKHAARYAPQNRVGDIAAFLSRNYPDDPGFQLSLYKAIQEGAGERGSGADPALKAWGATLAKKILDPANPEPGWRNFPLKNPTANPWFLQARASSDGEKQSLFLCSLPPGGERLTGALRSKDFPLPVRLSFFLAGHDGETDRPLRKKNFARLRDAQTGKILFQASPPRNDVAQPVAWDLSGVTNRESRKGYLELVDGGTGPTYAWLAAGRFSPDVAPLPQLSPRDREEQQRIAAELAGDLRLAESEPGLTAILQHPETDMEVKAAVARALAIINPEGHAQQLQDLLSNAGQSLAFREKLAGSLGEVDHPAARRLLGDAMGTAPVSLQNKIALSLSKSPAGAAVLLESVEQGKASRRLLQDRNVRDQLVASKVPGISERIEKLTANLPPASEEKQKLIDARRAAYGRAKFSQAEGERVLKQNCVVCHSLGGQGAVVGPQLDGVGGRGVDRIMEDILDPSRNVDVAFRTTVLVLQDGDVQSGLFRREEGELLVLADATGKEIKIPKKDVKERRETSTSLMPDNFGDVIPEADLYNLVAYLISKNVKPQNQGGASVKPKE